ncbi:MAG: hypothetical protein IKQ61_04760 [Spirochaetales bacterium]|nr:hypothetical protein [Spirochaetales bacterium]
MKRSVYFIIMAIFLTSCIYDPASSNSGNQTGIQSDHKISSLQAKFDNAADGDVIDFSGISIESGTLNINKAITIKGGDFSGGTLNVAKAGVSLQNVTNVSVASSSSMKISSSSLASLTIGSEESRSSTISETISISVTNSSAGNILMKIAKVCLALNDIIAKKVEIAESATGASVSFSGENTRIESIEAKTDSQIINEGNVSLPETTHAESVKVTQITMTANDKPTEIIVKGHQTTLYSDQIPNFAGVSVIGSYAVKDSDETDVTVLKSIKNYKIMIGSTVYYEDGSVMAETKLAAGNYTVSVTADGKTSEYRLKVSERPTGDETDKTFSLAGRIYNDPSGDFPPSSPESPHEIGCISFRSDTECCFVLDYGMAVIYLNYTIDYADKKITLVSADNEQIDVLSCNITGNVSESLEDITLIGEIEVRTNANTTIKGSYDLLCNYIGNTTDYKDQTYINRYENTVITFRNQRDFFFEFFDTVYSGHLDSGDTFDIYGDNPVTIKDILGNESTGNLSFNPCLGQVILTILSSEDDIFETNRKYYLTPSESSLFYNVLVATPNDAMSGTSSINLLNPPTSTNEFGLAGTRYYCKKMYYRDESKQYTIISAIINFLDDNSIDTSFSDGLIYKEEAERRVIVITTSDSNDNSGIQGQISEDGKTIDIGGDNSSSTEENRVWWSGTFQKVEAELFNLDGKTYTSTNVTLNGEVLSGVVYTINFNETTFTLTDNKGKDFAVSGSYYNISDKEIFTKSSGNEDYRGYTLDGIKITVTPDMESLTIITSVHNHPGIVGAQMITFSLN